MSESLQRTWTSRFPRSGAFLRAVAELSYDSVIVVDEAGRIRYQSPSTHHLLGYADDEVIGRHILEFPHPHDRGAVRHSLGLVGRSARGTVTLEVRLRRADGQFVWAQARLTNLRHHPAVRGIVVNTVLIDERKTLEMKHAAAKLDPHFLYNALHAIAGLVREGKGQEAVEALARIRNLTEGSLGSAEDRLVTLQEEWDWTRDYVALEQLRFGPELVVDVEPLPPAVESLLVPCRLIQPIVENAVKHGLRSRPGGGRLRLSAGIGPRGLRIQVIEEGATARTGQPVPGFGVGLRTLRERLSLHFGDDAAFALDVEPFRSVAVLTLPLPVPPAPIARRA